MAQNDNHPDLKTRQGRQHRQNLGPHPSTVPSGQNVGNTHAAKNTDTHPIPPCSTWPTDETQCMHCTVDDHRRNCCRLFKNKSRLATLLIALDLTAAFDNVDHQQLLDCVYDTSISAPIHHWLYSYIQNRRARVHLRQQESKSRKWKQEWYKAEFCLQRFSITIWLTFTHRRRTSS